MVKRYAFLFICVWGVISLFAGCSKFRATFIRLVEPMPISETNVPVQFYIIALNKDGRPELLLHEVAREHAQSKYENEEQFRRESEATWGKILWSDMNRPGHPYSFHIHSKQVDALASEVTNSLNDHLKHVEIYVIENNTKQDKQKIRVNYQNDDFAYYSIYSVDKNGVTPLEYGDCVKRDGAQALFAAFPTIALTNVLGLVLLFMVHVYEIRRSKV